MDINKSHIRFGMIAIDKGFATAKQVLMALEIQLEEDMSMGCHSWIGTILSEKGIITLAQLADILETLESARAKE